MATEAGHPTSRLIEQLLERAPEYDFFQALRLLLRERGITEPRESGLHRRLRIRPQLGLDYPENELVEIHRRDDDTFEVVTTLEGLYGVNAPLPASYTEELLDDEWDEQEAPREFLDVVHRYLYPLLYRAWLKYRFTQNAIESENPDYWSILYSLGGLGDTSFAEAVPDPSKALRYLGLLSLQTKSTVGLQTVLRDYLGTDDLEIDQCVPRWVDIPDDQTIALGRANTTLGEDAAIGAQIEDLAGKIEVQLGPLDGEAYHKLVSDPEKMRFIRVMLGFYMIQPLAVDLLIRLKPGTHPSATLGGTHWSCLGADTWVGSDASDQASVLRVRLQ